MQKDELSSGWFYLKGRLMSYHGASNIAQAQPQLILLDSRIHGGGSTCSIAYPCFYWKPLWSLHAPLWSCLRIEKMWVVSKIRNSKMFFFLNMYNRKIIFMISSVSCGNGSQWSFFVCRGSVRKRQGDKIRGRRLKPAQWNRAYGDS